MKTVEWEKVPLVLIYESNFFTKIIIIKISPHWNAENIVAYLNVYHQWWPCNCISGALINEYFESWESRFFLLFMSYKISSWIIWEKIFVNFCKKTFMHVKNVQMNPRVLKIKVYKVKNEYFIYRAKIFVFPFKAEVWESATRSD